MDAFDALALWRRTAGPDAPVPQPILDALEARHPGASAKVQASTPAPIYPDAVPAGEEGQLQRDCEVIVTDLVGQGILVDWWHRPWGRHRHAAKGRERSGLPDFLLAGSDALRCPCCGSAVAGTELKSGREQPGKYQQRWLGALGRRGAVCRSVEAFWGFLRGWGVTR